jgi:hypothetical protein
MLVRPAITAGFFCTMEIIVHSVSILESVEQIGLVIQNVGYRNGQLPGSRLTGEVLFDQIHMDD